MTAGEIERLAADNAADLLREQPGVDVNGVGPNQARPVIRGQRGLRVLFLEDGLRLNNARRQTDFGEISGLIDVGSVRAVEVVRGPASALYGADGLAGSVTFITKDPSDILKRDQKFAGRARVGYASADKSWTESLVLAGKSDRWEALVAYTRRDGEGQPQRLTCSL